MGRDPVTRDCVVAGAGMATAVEERDDEGAPEANDPGAVAERTRALVEESRQLLQRLERLLGRAGDSGGDGRDHQPSDDAEAADES